MSLDVAVQGHELRTNAAVATHDRINTTWRAVPFDSAQTPHKRRTKRTANFCDDLNKKSKITPPAFRCTLLEPADQAVPAHSPSATAKKQNILRCPPLILHRPFPSTAFLIGPASFEGSMALSE